MEVEYDVLLYHTEVRCLSRGHVLKRLFELRAEVSLFLKEKETPLLEHFERKNCIHGMAYLADIFNHMNAVHLSIQGPEVTIMDATETLQAFSNRRTLSRAQHACFFFGRSRVQILGLKHIPRQMLG
jgi:hypothetical protein